MSLGIDRRAAVAALAGAVAGALGYFAASHLGLLPKPRACTPSVAASTAEPATEQPHYVLIFTLKLKAGRREEFLRMWEPYAKWVRENEPNTSVYKAIVPEASCAYEDTVLIYERYTAKADLEAHQATPQFKRFADALGASGMVLSKGGEGFYEAAPGFAQR